VKLDCSGRAQAEKLVERLDGIPLAEILSSPLLRCKQTLAPLLGARRMTARINRAIAEVDYGDWTGRTIGSLAKEPLWRVVQAHPSAAIFPGGEGLAAVQQRAVAAIRATDRAVAEEHGDDAIWLACSHGDVIKSVLADALGSHLDSFQRIMVDPCSLSVIRFTETRPFVVRSNDNAGDLSALLPAPKKKSRRRRTGDSDAVVGGGTGQS
ncbi:MAG: MSMEG_4193 family putative phosphomutase, partial [Mycobacterium sp.]